MRANGLMAAALLLATVGDDLAGFRSTRRTPPLLPDPADVGRRAEKDAEALAKAQAKRDRKAAKRAAIAARMTATPTAGREA